jgi:hypothetical protein
MDVEVQALYGNRPLNEYTLILTCENPGFIGLNNFDTIVIVLIPVHLSYFYYPLFCLLKPLF